jgi:hypothetical protein
MVLRGRRERGSLPGLIQAPGTKVPGAYFFCAPGMVHLLGCIRSPGSAILNDLTSMRKTILITMGISSGKWFRFFEKK